MALSNGGKTAEQRYSASVGRVRTAADARLSRTVAPQVAAPAVVVSAAVASPVVSRKLATSARHSINRTAIANPSRDLVLARREALSRRGKRADTSSDRTRSDRTRSTAPTDSSKPCACKGDTSAQAVEQRPASTVFTASSSVAASSAANRPSQRRLAHHNPSRAIVLARRDALAKRGKQASSTMKSGTVAVVRQANPDLSSRELALKIRELRSRTGAASVLRTSSSTGSTRPSGPNRHGAKQALAADAHWKVGSSETLSGQIVTGTQANRSSKTTGNEAATCRAITGTEYLGAEVFKSFCQGQPAAQQPAKVRISATSHGNRVTGNAVGRSEKVTGDEPGTCKNITGTEYIAADQAAAWCGASKPAVRKVGRSQTLGGQAVSGVLVGRSERVTGDEIGSGLQLTGDQYLGREAPAGGRAPAKVISQQTLRGTGVTGTALGRSERVTGDEPGSCHSITGDEYIGTHQYERFCAARPAAEAAKVGFSITNRHQVVSGTRTGRSERVTGDEPGTCKAVTGTPYLGMEQAGEFCSPKALNSIRQRTPARVAQPLTGIQPGIGGVMTGAERGACEFVSGTPYVGAGQQREACGTASTNNAASEADFPQPLADAPWQRFSIQSPARVAQVERDRSGAVTGSSYELGGRITGPFDMASGVVTGTEQFRFDRSPAPARQAIALQADQSSPSRVTGEGSGLKVTGDDWDRGDRVTGTEGPSARRRNPSRSGSMTAMVMLQQKRNEEVTPPVSRVTGSSGNTDKGSLITVSGGARG
jgi:hypothetical protein